MNRHPNQVDLHIHTTASDGVLAPSEVVHLALERGLEVIALTDHDTLGGVPQAQQAAASTGLEVISGVEINSEGGWGDLHFLGYYVDLGNRSLQGRLRTIRDARVERARRMVERLREMGMVVEWEAVRILARGDSVGRPHVARALLDRGYVRTVQEAFERFIGNDGPAYFPRLRMTPPEVIQAIGEAGGVPVLAHPAHSGSAAIERIAEFVDYGLRGVEVYYPYHTPEDVEALLELCRKHGLLATGGSDFHSYPGSHFGGSSVVFSGVALGSVHVPLACVRRLREAAADQKKEEVPNV